MTENFTIYSRVGGTVWDIYVKHGSISIGRRHYEVKIIEAKNEKYNNTKHFFPIDSTIIQEINE